MINLRALPRLLKKTVELRNIFKNFLKHKFGLKIFLKTLKNIMKNLGHIAVHTFEYEFQPILVIYYCKHTRWFSFLMDSNVVFQTLASKLWNEIKTIYYNNIYHVCLKKKKTEMRGCFIIEWNTRRFLLILIAKPNE